MIGDGVSCGGGTATGAGAGAGGGGGGGGEGSEVLLFKVGTLGIS